MDLIAQSSGTQTAETRLEKTDILCVPGDKLCRASDKTMPATGTYKSEDYIYASLAGQIVINHVDNDVRYISVNGINKNGRAM